MIYWHDDQGRILQVSSDDTARSGFDHEPGVTRLHAPGYRDPNDYYVVGTSFKPKPAQPSPHHEFDYASKTWQLDLNRAWHAVRRERDGRLARTDWVVLRAADQGEPVSPEWLAYRQALRDVTAQADPLNIAWPVAPAA